jgi:hypothetical protein
MDLASSPISVEKNRVGPGVAGVPKKLDRCDVKHEIVAFILSGIRRSVAKRRTQEMRGLGDSGAAGTPHYMEGHKNKGVAKWDPHKRMKRKNEDDGAAG